MFGFLLLNNETSHKRVYWLYRQERLNLRKPSNRKKIRVESFEEDQIEPTGDHRPDAHFF